jgi:hypothetical protein
VDADTLRMRLRDLVLHRQGRAPRRDARVQYI